MHNFGLFYLKIVTQILTIAEISFMLCKYSTILDLCAGSTRENRRALATADFCSDRERSSNSRPEYDFPVVSSSSVNTPILRQIASAVA